MKNHSGTSIILGHRNFGEFDKLIFLYNEELGKTKAIAKGARKITSKFTGHLESLNVCKTQLYFGPKNTILTEIETIKVFKNIRRDLKKTNCALRIIEFTDKLIYENQNIKNLHNFLIETLECINKNENPQIVSAHYMINLLHESGFTPDFKETKTSLEEKYKKFFHFAQNNPLREVKKIKATKEEKIQIEKIISEIIKIQTSL